ncbi:type-F conjugative transfer system pilin assembly protein TrbC [Candidatus Odyssella thessalonicensis]|uniref:type-F conjugative transfer system pilin assembly protein TrbC n=1 Tax=Candidatus Odyssella thessalonicensis TaxID=84647 RepID=UPI000225ACE8|nr:type-F conjugative transfer system pilin assembly protein TrbC [Candidatus Odyssella thessalonicensis]
MLSFVKSGFLFLSLAQATPSVEDLQQNPAYAAGVAWAKKMAQAPQSKDEKHCCQAAAYLNKAVQERPRLSERQMVKQNSEQILVFVSFSMPDASLKALAHSAALQPVTLVLRGLIENSFKKTGEKVKDLNTALDINPQAFEDYHVTQVPTFILVRHGKEVARLSGNVTVEFAVTQLRGAA